MLKHVKFAHLPATDQDRALAFWRDRVGVALVTDESADAAGWRWIELEIAGAATRILLTRRADDTPSAEPDLILVCDDIEATFRQLSARGVAFTRPPAHAPWRPGERYALFRDSEGNLVMLGSG